MSAKSSADARQAWAAMRHFVAANDRHARLRAVLDLGPVKVQLLLLLADEPLTLREIAAALTIDPSAATVAVDRLQNRGLVTRTAHPDDARRKLVTLTQQGHDAADHGRQVLLEPPQTLAALTAEDLAALNRVLSQLQPPDAH